MLTYKEFYIWLDGYLTDKLENKHIDITPIVEKMNHVLKIIDKGDQSANIASYSNIAMPISAVLTDEIIKYIKK